MEPLRPDDPARVGVYTLTGRLGAGGMGRVYVGRSPAGLPVAVKVVHGHLANLPGFRSRFRREVAAARAVSGAFTAPLIDADPDAAAPWLVTTYLPGLSLQEAITVHGPMPVPAARALGAGLAEALVSIHRAEVVHRDLKPSNVLLGPDGPRLIDFGIAHVPEGTVVTVAGGVVGSPGFMAPEQATGGEVGPAADVFSLGAVLAFAVTGTGPFGPAPAAVLIYRVVQEPPRLDAVPDPGLRELIEACLSKDPAQRPAPDDVLRRLGRPGAGDDAPHGTGWLPDPMAHAIGRRAQEASAAIAGALPPPGPAPFTSPTGGGPTGGGPPGGPPGGPTGGGPVPGTWAPGAPVPDQRAYDPRTADQPVRNAGLGRRRLLVAGGTGAALLAVSGGGAWALMRDDSPQGGPDTSPTPSAATAGTGGAGGAVPTPVVHTAKLLWKYDTGNLIYSSPAVANGLVYVGSESGHLHAVDARTGKRRWRFPARLRITSAVAVVDGVVFTGSQDGTVYAIDARTGRLRWSTRLGTQADSDPTVLGGTVFVAGTDGNIGTGFRNSRLYALDRTNGSIRWVHRTKTTIRPGVAAAGGLVYVPDGDLFALDATTGKVRWKYAANSVRKPVVAGGSVYVGAFGDGLVHAVNARTGKRRWTYQAGRSIAATPAVGGGAVHIGDLDGDLYALDAASGAMRWQFQTDGSIWADAAVGEGVVFIGGGKRLYGVDAASGRARWFFTGGKQFERSCPVVVGRSVYVGNFDGRLYALDVAGGTGTANPHD